jgi:hypothetical protein
MRIGTLFDLLTDAKDLLQFFENVETTEQLVSRLERLKRQGTDDLLACKIGLEASINLLLNETLEMSASLDDDEEQVDPEIDSLLSAVSALRDDAEPTPEAPQQTEPPPSEELPFDNQPNAPPK